MKSRVTIDDIHTLVHDWETHCMGLRLSNVYDLDCGKTYLLKFALPGKKEYFVLEPGVRIHRTQYTRTKPKVPSQFTMKLRKHLRTKRLTAITQYTQDRVVQLTFGTGVATCHLIVELYAAGNLILTDMDFGILAVLRIRRIDENSRIAVKQVYTQPLEEERGAEMNSGEELLKWIRNMCTKSGEKKVKKMNLKQILLRPGSGFETLGGGLEHCVVRAGLKPNMKLSVITDEDSELGLSLQEATQLLSTLRETKQLLHTVGKVEEGGEDKGHKGYIILKPLDTKPEEDEKVPIEGMQIVEETKAFLIHVPREDGTGTDTVTKLATEVVYDEFVPFLYAQHENKPRIEFETFSKAVDEYFSKMETQQEEVQKKEAKTAAQKKYDRIHSDQQQRMDKLRELQDNSIHQAQLVEFNSEDIENVLIVIRSALSSGMGWDELKALVKIEQKKGNPVAQLIHAIDFKNKNVDVILSLPLEEDEEQDGDALVNIVKIDISKSALSNARDLYTQKKKSSAKEEKTIEATKKALVVAAKNAKHAKVKEDLKKTIHVMRKVYWFEKFHWFISSENYLILAGHDMQQNELLVKRYMRKGDIYVHADIHGAASCIIRNTNMDKPIPQLTIEEAGTMTVCRSAAWVNNVVTSAWWVHHDQVSKSAPSGEYVSTGSFMIRGKKNFINAARLEMGLGILFKVDESCVARHVGERKVRGNEEEEEVMEEEEEEETTCEETIKLRKFERTKLKKAEAEMQYMAKTAMEEADTDNAASAETKQDEKSGDDEMESEEEKVETSNATPVEHDEPKGAKKRLTARERRLLKKGVKMEDLESIALLDKEKEEVKSIELEEKKVVPKEVKKIEDTRGARRKMKKIKKKYAEQDEDERSLRIQALGNVHDDDATKSEDEKETTTISKILPKMTPQARAEIQSLNAEEKIVELPEDEKVDHLDMFTGQPHVDDLLHCALIVCAPYHTFSSYKYRVKLTPGPTKKGKACKQAMHLFVTAQNCSLVEKGVLKHITDNECVAACLPNVKLSAPGLAKVKKFQGKFKKKKK